MKTNGARFLESLGIAFELREYEVDPNDLLRSRLRRDRHACQQVFKTLLTTTGAGETSSR